MFTEEEGTTINIEDKIILNKKKCWNLLNLVTSKDLLGKINVSYFPVSEFF